MIFEYTSYYIMEKLRSVLNERGFTRNGIAADRLNTDLLVNTSPINNLKPSGLRPSDIFNHTDAYVKFN